MGEISGNAYHEGVKFRKFEIVITNNSKRFIGIKDFYQGVEFMYRFIREITKSHE